MLKSPSNDVDTIGRVDPIINPYVMTEDIDGWEVEKRKAIAQIKISRKKLWQIQLYAEGNQLDPDTQIVQLESCTIQGN